MPKTRDPRRASASASVAASAFPAPRARAISAATRRAACFSRCFSPRESPLANSRRIRSRTTSASGRRSPTRSRSVLFLNRRDQPSSSWEVGARRTSQSCSSSAASGTSRRPIRAAASAGMLITRSLRCTSRRRQRVGVPRMVRVKTSVIVAGPCCGWTMIWPIERFTRAPSAGEPHSTAVAARRRPRCRPDAAARGAPGGDAVGDGPGGPPAHASQHLIVSPLAARGPGEGLVTGLVRVDTHPGIL